MPEMIPARPPRYAGPKLAAAEELPPAPTHLSARSRRIWAGVVRDWVVGVDGLPLLRAGLEQLDLYDWATRLLRREGLTAETSAGTVRAHPAHRIAQEALAAYRQCFRALNLTPPAA